MASCPNITKNIKIQSYTPTKTVYELLEQLKNPKPLPQKSRKFQSQLDVNAIRAQMKKKWKDPGYANIQFTKPPIIRAKLLNQWETQRIYLAQRSYKFPKDFKGIKFDSQSRKFEEPSRQMNPPKFNVYLDKVKTRYEEKLFTIEPRIAEKKQRIIRMLTQNATKSTTNRDFRNSGFFGYSLNKKLKTAHNQ